MSWKRLDSASLLQLNYGSHCGAKFKDDVLPLLFFRILHIAENKHDGFSHPYF